MDVRRARLPLALIVGISLALVVGLSGAARLVGPRHLSPQERRCVGVWSFPRPGDPGTLHVYDLRNDGRAVERHYYLTSANPTVPRAIMYGDWRVEDDRLIVEGPEGLGALAVGARGIARGIARLARAGPEQRVGRTLRRIYRIRRIEPTRLVFRANHGRDEDGRPAEVEVVMTPFEGIPGVRR